MQSESTPKRYTPPAVVMKPDQQKPWWRALPIHRRKPSQSQPNVTPQSQQPSHEQSSIEQPVVPLWFYPQPNTPPSWVHPKNSDIPVQSFSSNDDFQSLMEQEQYEPYILQVRSSRRNFLKGVGALGAATGLVALLNYAGAIQITYNQTPAPGKNRPESVHKRPHDLKRHLKHEKP